MRVNKILSGEFCLEEEPKVLLCGELILVRVLPSLFAENGKVTPTISLFTHQVSKLVGLPQAKIQPVSAGLLGLFVLFCFLYCKRPVGYSPATLQASCLGPGLVLTWLDLCVSEGNSVGRRDSITLHFSVDTGGSEIRAWDQFFSLHSST